MAKQGMHIYADFNGMEECQLGSDDLCLDLTGYGTLASLSSHKVKLHEGQCLQFADPDGLRVTGIIHFYNEKVDRNCSGWFAKFSRSEISQGDPLHYDNDTHLCFKCRKNIKPHLDKVGRQYNEKCPFCGTSVMFPLLPP